MIIKRWNGSAFVEEFPKTKAQLVFNNGNTESIFDVNDQIKVKYLPQYVFDNLTFSGAKGGTYDLTALLYDLWDDLALWNQSLDFIRSQLMGKYIVQSSSGTITAHSTTTQTVTGGSGTFYARTFLAPSDGGTNSASATTDVLEAGDWLVITAVGNANGATSPNYVSVQFSVVNNVYELASTSVDGIVRLSSRSTYAGLTGNNVVTEGVLKTVIDNASFAASSHTHGDISNDGKISSAAITPASGDYIIVSDTSGSEVLKRGIAIGTSTTTYLRNDGTWVTPPDTNTTYSMMTSSTLGLGKLFSDTAQTVAANAVSATSNRTYGVQKNASDQLVVNVPWTDTDTTYSTATSSTNGLVKLGSDTTQSVAANAVSATSSRSYAVQLNGSGQMVVNVPWTDADTTYSAGEGITLSSTTFRMTYPLYVSTTTPTTSVTGTIWYDIN